MACTSIGRVEKSSWPVQVQAIVLSVKFLGHFGRVAFVREQLNTDSHAFSRSPTSRESGVTLEAHALYCPYEPGKGIICRLPKPASVPSTCKQAMLAKWQGEVCSRRVVELVRPCGQATWGSIVPSMYAGEMLRIVFPSPRS